MILITGGGTGGHLSIAKSLSEAYNKIGIKAVYIGSTNGQDMAWFENAPIFSKTIFLKNKGVVNQKGFKKIASLFTILKQTFECIKIFKEYKIDKVISVGGYASAPASFAALLCRIPLFVHEQNASIGTLNRLLKPYAKEFFSSYEDSSKCKDYPVSDLFFEVYRAREDVKRIIFLGGSQGAKAINTLAMKLAPYLKAKNISITHQCGKSDYAMLKEFYKNQHIHVELFEFSKSLHVQLQKADICIARAGAGSVWELSACGLPTLFIPYPHAASNHQYFNAKFLSDKGLATIIEERDLDVKDVIDWIERVDVKSISQNLPNLISKDGATKMVQIIQNS